MAGDRNVMAEGVQQYVYLVSEAGNALSAAVEAWKRGNSILDPMMDRFGQAYRESLTAQNLGFNENSITGKLADAYFSVLDKVSTKALGAEDEFWKRLHFNSELQARAWSEGVALGLEKKELRDFVADKLKAAQSDHPTFGSGFANPDDALGQSVLSSARDVTFTQPIKFNSVSGHLLHFTSAYRDAVLAALGRHLPGFRKLVRLKLCQGSCIGTPIGPGPVEVSRQPHALLMRQTCWCLPLPQPRKELPDLLEHGGLPEPHLAGVARAEGHPDLDSPRANAFGDRSFPNGQDDLLAPRSLKHVPRDAHPELLFGRPLAPHRPRHPENCHV